MSSLMRVAAMPVGPAGPAIGSLPDCVRLFLPTA